MSDGFTFLLDAPTEPTARLQIATLGDFQDGRYGEFSITRDDVASWQKNLALLPGQRALIDLDHSADRSPRRTEAAGWITGIDWDGDTPVADVEWTSIGRQSIEDKRYLFFSPTYGEFKDERGNVHDNTLVGGALTNKPFLTGMPAITLASEERVSEAVDRDLERLIELKTLDISAKDRKQAAADGNALQDGSYPIRNAAELHSAAVLAASGHGDVAGARKLIRKRASELGVSLSHLPGFKSTGSDSRRQMSTELLKTLGLDDNADDTKILEAVTALKDKADKATAPEPQGTKTLEQQAADNGKVLLDQERFTQLASDAAAGKRAADELHTQKFETSFAKLLDAGKETPAERDSWAEMYELNAEKTLSMMTRRLENGPPLVNVKPTGRTYQLDGSDAPEGVDPRSHQLHRKVLDKLTEKGWGQTRYLDAYNLVAEEAAVR